MPQLADYGKTPDTSLDPTLRRPAWPLRARARSSGVLALAALAVIAVVGACAPPLPDDETIHAAYRAGDAASYQAAVATRIQEARHLEPEACVTRQEALITNGAREGFDGLETLWLTYQDCAASSDDSDVAELRADNAGQLAKNLRFAQEPAPQIDQPVARWNSRVRRQVRSEAVRLVLQQAAASDGAASLDQAALFEQPRIRRALCDLPSRPNQHGQTALTELVRQARCLLDGVSGGGLGLETLCDELATTATGDEAGDALSPALATLSREQLERLRELCEQGGAMPGAGSLGIDPLDGFTSSGCFDGKKEDLEDLGRITKLVLDCFGTGSGHPLAGGSESAGTNPGQIHRWSYDEPGGTAHHAFVTVGEGKEGKHYHGIGETPGEAEDKVIEQVNASSGGSAGAQREDSTIEMEGITEVENSDGSVTETRWQSEDTVNEDGSSEYKYVTTSTTTYPDGSKETAKTVVKSSTDSQGNTTTTVETTNADGSKTTTTTTVDADGNTTTETTPSPAPGAGGGTTTPGFDGGFDPHNPACRELADLRMLDGRTNREFWDSIFARERGVDPRKAYPRPDGDEGIEEPSCLGLATAQVHSGSHCRSLVLCADGAELDENCQCKMPTGAPPRGQGCWAFNCPEGTMPESVGFNRCLCTTPGGDQDGDAPPPRPLPVANAPTLGAQDHFGELLWNRPGESTLWTASQIAEEGSSTRPPGD